ncbi:MAG: phosphoglucomutase/phosphomannomutase family protein [Flavobacteriales bacterium]
MSTPSPIRFGTDGWRAVIAKDMTVDNVARVSKATASYIKENSEDPKIVIGHDCRFAGQLFVETAAQVFAAEGIRVVLARDFVSTPMLSLATREYAASLGVIVTASHNPPEYNGYKLRGSYGGALTPDQVAEVEKRVPDEVPEAVNGKGVEELKAEGKVEVADLEKLYCDRIKGSFDLKAIEDSGMTLAYDAMFGAGQRVFDHIFPEMVCLHCEYNPSFKGTPPEPIERNLRECAEYIKDRMEIDCGLATDGDADRLGLFNGQGRFIDSHHIILLVLHYLVAHKGMKGKVVTAFSCSKKIERLCQYHGLEHETVKIGFKHIVNIMLREDVLLGGEESGGIAIKGHIPERDGIWIGMLLWEYMAKTGNSINELIREVYGIVGEFAFQRRDLHIDEDVKQRIIEDCERGSYSRFGDFEVKRMESLDGFKFFLNEDEWVMIRPSGTEPVLRTYSEASDRKRAQDILQACRETILEGNRVKE